MYRRIREQQHLPQLMEASGLSLPPRSNRRAPATPETVVKPTKQGRAARATKAETKLEVDQALSQAPASAAGPGTIVVAGKDAHAGASYGKSTTPTPEEKPAKVPRTAGADKNKIKIDTATAPALEAAAETTPWEQLEEAPKGCAQIGG